MELVLVTGEYRTTTFTFDDANQLVSSTCDGITTRYEYDAAGRLVREGNRTYTYGYLDKVMSVRFDRSSANSSTSQPLNSSTVYTYTYHPDGQLATADYGKDGSEDFTWDGLALIKRGDEQFINEPHVGGGNPVASSKGTSYFNDALGTTVGSKSNGKYSAAALTAFGESLSADTSNSQLTTHNSQTFFTGKPMVEGLGHAFWMRNYRAGLAKWQSADPMGYPDGWNQLAYCNNGVTTAVDLWGCERQNPYRDGEFYRAIDGNGYAIEGPVLIAAPELKRTVIDGKTYYYKTYKYYQGVCNRWTAEGQGIEVGGGVEITRTLTLDYTVTGEIGAEFGVEGIGSIMSKIGTSFEISFSESYTIKLPSAGIPGKAGYRLHYWAYEEWTSTVIYSDPEATKYIGAIKAPSTTTHEFKEYVE